MLSIVLLLREGLQVLSLSILIPVYRSAYTFAKWKEVVTATSLTAAQALSRASTTSRNGPEGLHAAGAPAGFPNLCTSGRARLIAHSAYRLAATI
jgi:hypothetical protein